MIEVKDLVKKYGSHLAVDHLSFTLESGKIYGFLGPNGAGKSTTMNIMTGYLGATQGSVLIDGHDILKEPEEAKKHIGYLPELPPSPQPTCPHTPEHSYSAPAFLPEAHLCTFSLLFPPVILNLIQ